MYTANELQEPNVYKNAPPYTTVKLTWRHVEKQPNVARPARLHARRSFFSFFPTPNSKMCPKKKKKNIPQVKGRREDLVRGTTTQKGVYLYMCV